MRLHSRVPSRSASRHGRPSSRTGATSCTEAEQGWPRSGSSSRSATRPFPSRSA